MPREVFKSRVPTSRRLSVSTENIARRNLVDPGDYAVRIEKAALVQTRAGNVSAVLEVIDPESGDYFDVRPMWIAGPNASTGNMVSRNISLLSDLLEVCGIARDTYKELTDDLLMRLVGRVVDLTLDVDRGAQGGVFNIISRVNGALAVDDVVQLRKSAAD